MDILFLDIHINPHDGLTIFEKVHQKKRDLPIVFISAGILLEEVKWARSNGLSACMEKPISTDNLLNLVYEILGGQNNRFRFIRSTF